MDPKLDVPKKEAITITENPRSVLNKVSSVQYDSMVMENLKIVHISPSIQMLLGTLSVHYSFPGSGWTLSLLSLSLLLLSK